MRVLSCNNDFPSDLISAVKSGDETQVVDALEKLIDPNTEALLSLRLFFGCCSNSK